MLFTKKKIYSNQKSVQYLIYISDDYAEIIPILTQNI